MKDELCRICGCNMDEYTKCKECNLVVTTICKCCQKIEEIQIHTH